MAAARALELEANIKWSWIGHTEAGAGLPEAMAAARTLELELDIERPISIADVRGREDVNIVEDAWPLLGEDRLPVVGGRVGWGGDAAASGMDGGEGPLGPWGLCALMLLVENDRRGLLPRDPRRGLGCDVRWPRLPAPECLPFCVAGACRECVRACVHAHACLCVRACICACTCVFVCTRAHVCLCMCSSARWARGGGTRQVGDMLRRVRVK